MSDIIESLRREPLPYWIATISVRELRSMGIIGWFKAMRMRRAGIRQLRDIPGFDRVRRPPVGHHFAFTQTASILNELGWL